MEATGAGFANTWKAQSSCQDKLDWLDDPCSLNIESGEARPPPGTWASWWDVVGGWGREGTWPCCSVPAIRRLLSGAGLCHLPHDGHLPSDTQKGQAH